jgi:hypothetical protein
MATVIWLIALLTFRESSSFVTRINESEDPIVELNRTEIETKPETKSLSFA